MSKSTVLDHAIEILLRVERDGAYASLLLEQAGKKKVVAAEQQGLLRVMVNGTLERKGELEKGLNKFIRRGVETLPPKVQVILRLTAYQLFFMDSTVEQQAVFGAVEQAKKHGHPGLGRLVNGVLRSMLRAERSEIFPELTLDGSSSELAESLNHPLWLFERWQEQLGREEAVALCQANNASWPTTLRVNLLKGDREALLRLLAKEGVQAEIAAFHPECIVLLDLPEQKSISDLQSYSSGWFQVQDQSSAFVGSICQPQKGEIVLDVCAAPGGKSTHLGGQARNEAFLFAADRSRKRLSLVRSACERLGIKAHYIHAAAENFPVREKASLVLVDAPCSGLGVLGTKSDLRWNKSEKDILELQRLQKKILSGAAQAVSPGGRLVYSTCTVTPEENEDVITWFLKEHEMFTIDKLPVTLPQELCTADGFFRSWPHRHKMSGAFAALLKKVEK